MPIKRGEETLGIVCVSAYRGEDRFFEQYARETGIPHGLLMEKALHLRPLCECDEERVRMLVKPLCAMLSILLGECDESVSSAEDDLYSRMLSHIHGNAYENEVTIDTISSACYCSKSTVSHIFKKHSGTSVNQYVTNLRMERAKKLLLGTDMSITDIAYSCGYTDSNYFIYAFGRANGIPPLRYRKSHKASAF